ncbi:NUDIX hydrolase [Actinoplanes sp. NPDC023714]|uniref:NUDIX hydrolase n=1 Tax=Actinoplanes sp. NPDC023714 TaxID=3154322 RepID=UPI0033D7E593
MPETELAAGGVLYRDGRICLVHRPRYDDWSLPKGRLTPGEPALLGALREVEEETGTPGVPQLRLPDVDYVLPGGRPKNVAYWLMLATSDGPVQDADEVDEVAWLPLAEARERLTYPDERDLLDHVAGLPPITSVIAMVRHAHAGERKKWNGRDALRPIDPEGAKQAERIAATLTPFRPRRLVAAPPLRCSQTLEPLAAALGNQPVILDGAFAEPADPAGLPAKLAAARSRIAQLRGDGRVVICSQGKVMPSLLAAIAGRDDTERFKTRKGDGWLLTWSGERLLGVSRL